jgi:hypothetical protein
MVEMLAGNGECGNEGGTMSRRQSLVIEVSLVTSALLSPGVLLAQRGLAPAAHVTLTAGPQTMHAPLDVTLGTHSTLARPSSAGTRFNAPHATAHSNGSKALASTYPSRPNSIYRSNSNYNPSYSYDAYPAPGLGFDFVHYAAVHPNMRNVHFKGAGIVPIFGGGFYFPGGGNAEPETADNQYLAARQNEFPPPSTDVGESETLMDEVPSVPYVQSKPTPVPSSTEYIFVRRDGSVFFAVAYSWVNGNLQYVTQDGFRKLASLSALDLDATAQFNEQRGVAFHSPA